MLHTAIITVMALPIQLVLGLLLAFHFLEDRPFKRVFVALLIIPSVISPMVAGSMWRLMFDDRYGPINQIIGWIVGERVSLLWTIKIHLVYPAIIVCDVWQWTPFMFIILLAALANVDQEQLDAASIDGANRWQAFRNVTLPAIWPVMMIALLIRALDLIRVFDIVWQLTRGGPGTATETHLDLRLCPRLPGVRHELCRRHRRRADRRPLRAAHRRAATHGDRAMSELARGGARRRLVRGVDRHHSSSCSSRSTGCSRSR